jgi:hypothetical protein
LGQHHYANWAIKIQLATDHRIINASPLKGNIMNFKIIVAAAFTSILSLSAAGADSLIASADNRALLNPKEPDDKPTYEQLVKSVTKLREQLATHVQAHESTQTKTGFHLVALFKSDINEKDKSNTGEAKSLLLEALKLKSKKSFGLPTDDYNWNCNTCRDSKRGNTVWKTAKGEYSLVPKAWAWTYVAVRTFASGQEADQWLNDTQEGQFVKKYAEHVFTSTTTMFAD